MQVAKIISSTFQNTQEKIKAELHGFKNSFSKIGDSDFRFLIKVSALLILLPLIIAIFAEGSPISSIAFWVFVISGLILFFVWLGYLVKSVFFTVFGIASKTVNTTYDFVSTPRMELSFHYLVFRIKDLYILLEYQLSSFFDKPIIPKKGERLTQWTERIEPMQAYKVYRARFKNAQNMIDYYNAIGLDRLIDSEREKRLKHYDYHQKLLTSAEKGMKRAIERIQK